MLINLGNLGHWEIKQQYLTDNKIVLPSGVTELYVTFEGPAGKNHLVM
ncbi:hypothetical protein [Paenibacillus monticola]|uniref:Uncharacterized protein n=1 Tax=Paenibacillus monticola TaxID=2666075 RepID=A0A7X2L4Y8_9BACL|nr:hypothetical protein [Paenibacillus monticola]MRN56858.1 hypothetical protein [Paenibacillus monticola]